ncbi:MAG: STAS domain-containing protein, partial [Planctomycetales bacterium]|nr:STAS domain-containing protein [Planctomycetales bacterium]
ELMEVAVIAQGAARLTIDLRGVEVMSSAMLGKLVLLNKKAKAMSVKLNFCNPSPSVYELLNRYGRGGSGPAQPA